MQPENNTLHPCKVFDTKIIKNILNSTKKQCDFCMRYKLDFIVKTFDLQTVQDCA